MVGPQEVIAWQQTGVEELHGCCLSAFTGEPCVPV
jgi:hypothetical protein